MKYFLFFIFGIAVGVIIMSLIPSSNYGHHSVIYDTVVDTVVYYKPVPRDSVVIRYVAERLPVQCDSAHLTNEVSKQDSANVIIPITQTVYEDSTYTAYVSGYRASLDSIAIYNQTVTIREKSAVSSPRLSVGLIGGVGCGNQGVSPFIGIGVSYRLWNIR